MKNFFRTSLYFFAFAIAGVMFQIACSNADDSSSPNAQVNKIIYTKWDTSGQSIWTCNYDGSNQTQIPISLPPNTQFNTSNGDANPTLSPDGMKVFFVLNNGSGGNSIYSCDIDGSNVQEIVLPASAANLSIGNTN